MAMSERTINQVRNILGKLDRSIDEARERRLGQDGSEPVRPETPSAEPARSEPERSAPAPAAPGIGHSTGPKAGASPFGRAKPLQRPGNSTGRWTG